MSEWSKVKDWTEYNRALKLCKGEYQRDLIRGNSNLSGSSLKGYAREFSGRYAQSRQNLLLRMKENGVLFSEEREDHGKRILVIGRDDTVSVPLVNLNGSYYGTDKREVEYNAVICLPFIVYLSSYESGYMEKCNHCILQISSSKSEGWKKVRIERNKAYFNSGDEYVTKGQIRFLKGQRTIDGRKLPVIKRGTSYFFYARVIPTEK